jgi:hypothetical protein
MGHGERKLAANSEQQAEEKGQRGDCGLETGSTDYRQWIAERNLVFLPNLFSQTTNELWPERKLPFIFPADESMSFDRDCIGQNYRSEE